ncbi:preprotein translocase subunit YajC [Candidatus Vesicomyidisocius sp. SY067_SCS001]|uniref:preprotein translocase subunit YajC n=1 Tax=Candidatus Vesicomyidisocius sp. SY067_SCS001 TaxID=2732590 RepID=UPI0016846550|nr:preprotein translocase subunit YajC [Candidatus Vesicomyosocius sp. SY067_SCS001]
MNLLDLIIVPAFAEGLVSESSIIDSWSGLPFLLVMFALMYFLLIRPQQKRAKEHKILLVALKKDDEVVTNGGIVGKVVSVDESFAILEIANGVVVKVQKQGINQKMPKGSAKI